MGAESMREKKGATAGKGVAQILLQRIVQKGICFIAIGTAGRVMERTLLCTRSDVDAEAQECRSLGRMKSEEGKQT